MRILVREVLVVVRGPRWERCTELTSAVLALRCPERWNTGPLRTWCPVEEPRLRCSAGFGSRVLANARDIAVQLNKCRTRRNIKVRRKFFRDRDKLYQILLAGVQDVPLV